MDDLNACGDHGSLGASRRGFLRLATAILSMIVGYFVVKHFSTGFLPIGVALLFLGLTFLALKFIDEKLSGGSAFYPHINRVLGYYQRESDRCTLGK